MRYLKIYYVDAFTNATFNGNRAGVVIDDINLSNDEMQSIAREINASETAFIKFINNTYKLSFYTPTTEIDFCGHATIAASYILGSINGFKNIDFNTNIGIIPIQLEYLKSQIDKVIMKQIEPQIKDIDDDTDYLLNILGLNKNDYDNRYKIKLSYTGNWDLLLPIKSKEAIDNARPNMQLLKEHNLKNNLISVHLFTFNTDNDNYLLYTRNFGPACGIDEDLVTGSTNGALAGYLVYENILKRNNQQFKILQGNSQNRLGEIFININFINDEINLYVGGRAVITYVGLMRIE